VTLFHRFAGSAVLAALLAGCATPIPPPVVNLAERQCVTLPNLAGAQQLVFTPDKSQNVTVTYDDTTPCLEDQPGSRSLYRVFALPAPTQPYLIAIGSEIWGSTLFAPRVQFLGSDGRVKRTVARPDFVFRRKSLSTLLRSHSDEAYLVIASDPQVVGLKNILVDDTTGAMPIVVGRVAFIMYTGADAMSTQLFSHGGRVTVSLEALPTK
jgi:hypothetical protein